VLFIGDDWAEDHVRHEASDKSNGGERSPDNASGDFLMATDTPGRVGPARRCGSGQRDEKVYARNQCLTQSWGQPDPGDAGEGGSRGQPAVVDSAYATIMTSHARMIALLNTQIAKLAEVVTAHFGQHRDAEIYASQATSELMVKCSPTSRGPSSHQRSGLLTTGGRTI
jgi:hypothetical protein